MGVLFIFVFVLVMTLAAFFPNDGLQESADSVARRGEMAAGAMVAYHSAATRSCYNPKLVCSYGTIPASQVVPKLPTAYASVAATIADGRFVSFVDDEYIYTFYTGSGYGPGEAKVKMRSTLDALMRDLPPDTKSSVGFNDQSYFQPVGNVYLFSDSGGQGYDAQGALPPRYVEVGDATIPNNAPMVRTRISRVF